MSSQNQQSKERVSAELQKWGDELRARQREESDDEQHSSRHMTLARTEEFVKREYEQNNQVPAEAFRWCFLPFFLGEEVPPEVTQGRGQPNIGHWIALAGGPYRPVDIINESGEKILEVPPVLDNTVLDHSIHDKSAAMREAIVSSREILTHNPAQSNRYLEHLYQHELKRLVVKPLDIDHIIAWNKIFAYYGKPLIAIEGFDLNKLAKDRDNGKNNTADVGATGAAQPAATDDGVEYEDG